MVTVVLDSGPGVPVFVFVLVLVLSPYKGSVKIEFYMRVYGCS